MSQTPATFADAREQFLQLVNDVRPELHRYCARLTGSVIEGEDIVQDVLARAFYALSLTADVPPLRPWLFRIAHNTAIDFLKSHGRKQVDLVSEFADDAGYEEAPEPAAIRAALGQFLALPLVQRSAIILKDVLGHSLEETAETMGTTIAAVKAALIRGRANLKQANEQATELDVPLADLQRYASMFNARNWNGVRAMVAEDCRLDLVSKSQRQGKQVGMYFGRYEKENVSLRVVRLEGQLAFAAYVADAATPAYFILASFENGQLKAIRDFRYVPYIAAEAEFELLPAPTA